MPRRHDHGAPPAAARFLRRADEIEGIDRPIACTVLASTVPDVPPCTPDPDVPAASWRLPYGFCSVRSTIIAVPTKKPTRRGQKRGNLFPLAGAEGSRSI